MSSVRNPSLLLRSEYCSDRFIARILVFVLCVGAAGCQRWPGVQQARQFQIDSERLLGEFRAQKKRADELAAKNQLLEQRLAESEKSLAKQNLTTNRYRNSRGGSNLNIGELPRATDRLSTDGSSRTNPLNSRDFDKGGLPDVSPTINGLLSSSRGNGDPGDPLVDPNKFPQWRPIQKR
jgi:hypothetical protein